MGGASNPMVLDLPAASGSRLRDGSGSAGGYETNREFQNLELGVCRDVRGPS